MQTEQLKLKLQSLGALRPEAWEMICQEMGSVALKPDQSFIRKAGTLSYLAHGVLKEYDAQDRYQPAIINFLGANDALITREQNRTHYLKACTECIIYYWDFEALERLYAQFRELKIIYDSLCAGYDHRIKLRVRLLELPVSGRIEIFKTVFMRLLPYLKKKDMANYLHLNYSHFIKIWNK